MLGTLLDTKVVGLPLEGSMQGWIVILIVTSSKQNREGKKTYRQWGQLHCVSALGQPHPWHTSMSSLTLTLAVVLLFINICCVLS